MPLFLHRSCGALAGVCADDTGRYAADCIHLIDAGDGTYRLEATDLRRCVVVRGRTEGPPCHPLDDYPQVHGGRALVPWTAWKTAFQMGDKKHDPKIAAAVGPDAVAFFARGDRKEVACDPGRRFPDVNSIIPKGPARFSIIVDPALLAGLLTVCAKVAAGDREDPRVELLFYASDRALGLRCGKGDLLLDALLMPLS